MFSERLERALEVLSEDPTSDKQTIREQAEAMMGVELSDEDQAKLVVLANTAMTRFMKFADQDKLDSRQALACGATCILLIGIGIGKRLGIEDGMEMPRYD